MNVKEEIKWNSYYESLELPPVGSESNSIYSELVGYVRKLVSQEENLRTLEAGCGSGLHSLALAKAGFQVSVLDCAYEAIMTAKKVFKREDICGAFYHGDIFNDDELAGFDIVFNSGVLEHYSYEEQVRFVKALARRSSKYVLILVPNRDCYWYWVWRIHQQSKGSWPFGFEKPTVDYSQVFSEAGIDLIDKTFFGCDWTNGFIQSFGFSDGFAELISSIHKSGIVGVSNCAYLVGFLGKKSEYDSKDALGVLFDKQQHERSADFVDRSLALATEALGMSFKKERHERNADFVDRSVALAADALATLIYERSLYHEECKRRVAERDREITSLDGVLQSKEAELLTLKASASWILTRPLRFTKRLFQNPKRAAYDLGKFVFWCLPPTTRQALRGTRGARHRFIRLVKNFPMPRLIRRCFGGDNALELTWEDFRAQVLSRRSEYKGVFIQEGVIDWNTLLYQRPQHMSCAFGRLGYLVVYKTDDLWSANRVRNLAPNVWVTGCRKVNAIEGAVFSFYSTDYAITSEYISRIKCAQRVIYEYIDQIDQQISGDAENIHRLLELKNFAFSGGVDFIVTSARKLQEEACEAVGKDKVVLAQNGVDTRHYRNSIHQNTRLPKRLVSFRRKYSNLVGYFGALAPWLWYEEISELVKARPDLGFVFIGPDYYGGGDKLPKDRNVLRFGGVDYKILPAYARQFDVCFIPFAPGEIARTTSPLKLFEYFALEKPVVVTSEMEECIAFKEVFSGDSAVSLSQAIDAAIDVKDDPAFKARAAQLADENNWDERARAMEVIFE